MKRTCLNATAAIVTAAFVLAAGTAVVWPQESPEGPVLDESACGDYAALAEMLPARYDENRIGGGIGNLGVSDRNAALLFEVWAAPDGETWTISIAGPDGRACVAAVGRNWERQD